MYRLIKKKYINCILACAVVCVLLLSGCSGSSRSSAPSEVDYSVQGLRSNYSRVLVPSQDASEGDADFLGNEETDIDISNMREGYISARYKGNAGKVKLRLTTTDGMVYTYDLTTDGAWNILPLSCGDGDYILGVYSNIEGTMYAEIFSAEVTVSLRDEFGPFLYPNQYCWFDENSNAVKESERICYPADTDLDAVSLIYNYVVSHVIYDHEEAENVQSGYLPDVDEVLETGKGICLDYSSLMACMLRSQGIPARMEIGYAGTAYHAWISCYITDVGWVNGLIEFDGTQWSLMDATFAASQGEKQLRKFIGDGDNYKTVYLY